MARGDISPSKWRWLGFPTLKGQVCGSTLGPSRVSTRLARRAPAGSAARQRLRSPPGNRHPHEPQMRLPWGRAGAQDRAMLALPVRPAYNVPVMGAVTPCSSQTLTRPD
jgi:hypothetical protein